MVDVTHRWALFAVVLLAAGAPSAVAQQTTGTASVDLSLPVLADPVTPKTAEETSATVRYRWNNGMSTDNTTIRLEVVDQPDWLNASFRPSTVQFDTSEQGPQGADSRIVNLTLDVAPKTLAFLEGSVTFRAIAEESGTLPSAQTETSLPVTVGFSGRLNATLPSGGNVTAWGGMDNKVPIAFENNANGPIDIDVRVARSPADAVLEPPEDVRLGSSPSNETTTRDLLVRVPWTVSESGLVQLEVTSHHVNRDVGPPPVNLEFELDGKSAVPIPGPSPIAVFAALGLAIAGRRHL